MSSDWPDAKSRINLDIQDLPHKSANTEWWYFNSHLKVDKSLKEFSTFVSFFRADQNKHSLAWGISNVDTKTYVSDVVLDKSAPRMFKDMIEKDQYNCLDWGVRSALLEMCQRGDFPGPDRIATEEASVSLDKFDIKFENCTITKDFNGFYQIHCENGTRSMTLCFKPMKAPLRQCHDGHINMNTDVMFYYFIPRCDITGTLFIDGVEYPVSGTGWYDHQFGTLTSAWANNNSCWDWLAIQLNDGSDVTATHLFSADKTALWAIDVDEKGVRCEYYDIKLEPITYWQSTRTTCKYPIAWRLVLPSAKLELTVAAEFPDQECITLLSKPAFYEGRMKVSGTRNGKPVDGLCFFESHGASPLKSLDSFFKSVSEMSMESISKFLPRNGNYDIVKSLLADSSSPERYMDGVDIDVFNKSIVVPLREIIDRGGKTWRSYALLLCIDAVGGTSAKYKDWLVMPELLHVGSLIIDDIQDKSTIRRGKKSCHLIHGEDIAINAGTDAYFLAISVVTRTPWLTAEQRVMIYESFHLALRAGHAGQAFDIVGVDHMMPSVIETGNSKELEKRIYATHRLKSAVPPSILARIGSTLGGGTLEQVDALSEYFEIMGIAFQIIDDVLNLSGFEGKTKTRGEDIKSGKITYPIAKAMGIISCARERARIWDIIRSKPQDQKIVEQICNDLEKTGAIESASIEANTMVEAAWKRVSSVLPNNFYKLILRAFGFYLLQRHY
jgi:geranylgeranyl pyrophosphate synthase/predicted secreted hydrolase